MLAEREKQVVTIVFEAKATAKGVSLMFAEVVLMEA